MKKNVTGFFLLLLVITADVYSQREYDNWYFGKFAGITFKTMSGEPEPLHFNRMQQYEGCASISDIMGNLVLYSNGTVVHNGNGTLLNEQGQFLKGHQSSTQSALIVRKPGSSQLYYIFTADAGEYFDPPNEGINYSVVDITANGGIGKIIELNTPLVSPASEKLSATPHSNGKDIWILARGYKNNNFYAWLLTENGITDTVITSIGFSPFTNYQTIGYMKFSPKGNKVALVYQERDIFEIYRFDNKSGKLSDKIDVPITDYYSLYGVEFSPNGNFLYVANSRNAGNFFHLFQFDISQHDSSLISKSKLQIANEKGHAGSLQLAPNNKIYMPIVDERYLSSIENPNLRYPNCGWKMNSTSLADSVGNLGLPQSIPKYNYFKNIIVCENSPFSLDPEDFLFDTAKYENTYKWMGPNGYESNKAVPFFSAATLNLSGEYILNIKYIVNGDTSVINFINNVIVVPRNDFKIIGPEFGCEGASVILSPDTSNPLFRYRWNDGTRNRNLEVTKSGTYKLYITSTSGCVDSAEFKITFIPKPISNINGSRLLCGDEPVTLESEIKSDTLTYLWSTGSKNSSVSVLDSGWYWLKVMNSYGCYDSSSIYIRRYDDLEISIGGDSVICSPNAVFLYAIIKPYDSTLSYNFDWSSGNTDSAFHYNKPGKIELKVTIEGVCVYQTDKILYKSNTPQIELNYKDTVGVCEGDVIQIEILNYNPDYKYLWSTGDTSSSIEVSKKGLYSVSVENSLGCSSETSVYLKVFKIEDAYIETHYFTQNCFTDSVSLSAYPKGNGYKYLWSNNSTTDSIIVKKSGLYTVSVIDTNGCTDTAFVSITVGKGMSVKITGNHAACVGDEIILKAQPDYLGNIDDFSFRWSTGETTQEIKVTESGSFNVDVQHKGGCSGADSTDVMFYEIPDVELNYTGKIEVCSDSLILLEPIEINPYFTYIWNDGNKSPKRMISKSGVYRLYVSNKNYCFDSAEVEIQFIELKKISINSDKNPVICPGEKIKLFVSDSSDLSFKWSDKTSSGSIIVDKPGVYYVVYSNYLGCSDSASIEVKESILDNFIITSDKIEICDGDSATLSVPDIYSEYLWSTGETTSTIKVGMAHKYNVTVKNVNGCSGSAEIEIKAVDFENALRIAGNTKLTGCKSELDTNAYLENFGNNILIISDIIYEKDNLEILNENDLIGKILPYQKKKINFRLKATSPGIYSIPVNFKIDKPCFGEYHTVITYTYEVQTAVSIDTVKFESGSVQCIPVHYKLLCPYDFASIDNLKITIDFPADYFSPESVSFGKIIETQYIDSIVRIVIEVKDFKINNLDSLLFDICGRVLIGSGKYAQITVKDFVWDNPYIKVIKDNGNIATIGCVINLRGIKYFKPTSINISPNPVESIFSINVETQSIGNHKLFIYSSKGDIVKEIIIKIDENSPLSHKFLLNSSELNQGFYNVILESPWGVINTERFIVIK